MMFFIVCTLVFSLISFIICKTARGRDLFINYALAAYICVLASAHLTQTFVILLYIAGISFITYIFYKEGKK